MLRVCVGSKAEQHRFPQQEDDSLGCAGGTAFVEFEGAKSLTTSALQTQKPGGWSIGKQTANSKTRPRRNNNFFSPSAIITPLATKVNHVSIKVVDHDTIQCSISISKRSDQSLAYFSFLCSGTEGSTDREAE